MPVNQLILCPERPELVPSDTAALLQRLHAIGFIADTLTFEGREHYRPGEDFLQLITFLGCSPVVALGEPGATGDEFCHIQFDGPSAKPQFIAGSNVKVPRCPGCGHRLEQWQPEIKAWQENAEHVWRCPECGNEYSPTLLRWRQCAGFGRYFITVWGVFEGEAVPSEELLNALRELSDFDWRYFYVRY